MPHDDVTTTTGRFVLTLQDGADDAGMITAALHDQVGLQVTSASERRIAGGIPSTMPLLFTRLGVAVVEADVDQQQRLRDLVGTPGSWLRALER